MSVQQYEESLNRMESKRDQREYRKMLALKFRDFIGVFMARRIISDKFDSDFDADTETANSNIHSTPIIEFISNADDDVL